MPKFQVYKDSAGKFRFRLRADNNRIVAVGEAYEQHASCINGIKSIQKNCNAGIEDLTIEGRKISNPKYQVFKDAAGNFRFRLKATNGEIIAESEGYETKDACLNGIEVVRKSCDAEIEDLPGSDESIGDNVSSSKLEDLAKPQESTAAGTAEPKVATSDKKDEMLEELRKIRLSLEKGPPPQPPKGLWNEFKDFLSKYQILGLAAAFVLGLYLGAVVLALVKDFIMPLIGLAIPGLANLATLAVTFMNQVFGIGDFLVALITFIIVAFIVFIIVKVAKKWRID